MPANTWIDSHCHLHDERIPGGAEAAVLAGREAGVTTMITVGCDVATSLAAIAVAEQFDDVWATVGLHPHDAKNGVDTLLANTGLANTGLANTGLANTGLANTGLADTAVSDPGGGDTGISMFDHPRVVAVGECGLDYFYDHSPREVQREAFARQIRLANELQLPLVIHTRDAWADTFAVLRAQGVPPRTIFHCFTGGPDEATACLELGAFLSFSGIVTFKTATDLQAAAVLCPLDRMMVETDSPYLAPLPHRGKPNQPANVALVGRFIARLRGVADDTVAAATSAAACLAFPRIAP